MKGENHCNTHIVMHIAKILGKEVAGLPAEVIHTPENPSFFAKWCFLFKKIPMPQIKIAL